MPPFNEDQLEYLSKHTKDAVEANAKHLRMSPETREAITTMKDDLNEVKTTQAEQGKDISYMREGFDELKKDLRDFIDKAPEQFASKLTEKIVYAMAGALLLALLYYALKQIGIQ